MLLAAFILVCCLQTFAANVPVSQPTSPKTKKTNPEVVYAVWYTVPPKSLAHRRAKISELTAAHNRLPLGTLVRVTHVSNGKSVIVRITDRGITNKRAKIDVCREAAVKLDMIREGSARVRLEIVPETVAAPAPETSEVAAH